MADKLAIVGAGGAGRSLLALLRQIDRSADCFYEEASHFQAREVMDLPVRMLEDFEPDRHQLLLAIGAPRERIRLAETLPPQTRFASCVHPQAFLLEPLEIPPGTIIYPMTYLSRNIRLGPHSLIMTGTILGHDLRLGAGLTTSAHVSVGGGANIGEAVFCGLNSAIRDGIRVADDVVLGMGAIAVKDLSEPGVYIGNPARKKD